MTAWKSGPGYDGWRVHVDQVFVPVPESVFAVSGALEEDRTFQLPVWICTAHFYLSDIAKTSVLPTLFLVVTNLVENQTRGRNLERTLPRTSFVQSRRCAVFPQ